VLEYHFENREDSIMTKEKLLRNGDLNEDQLARDRAADAAYR
jgi:NADH-quinone oxidoreductase subunit I